MNEITIIVQFLFVNILAGLIGTAGMTIVMYLITRSGWTNANMVAAIGSIFTKSLDNAPGVGLILHFVSGVIFGNIYTLLFKIAGIQGFLDTAGLGLGFGFVHGFALSFILVVVVAEHHPLQEFQEAGFSVAIAHIVGHMVYGTLVGAVIGFSGILG